MRPRGGGAVYTTSNSKINFRSAKENRPMIQRDIGVEDIRGGVDYRLTIENMLWICSPQTCRGKDRSLLKNVSS